MSDKQKILEFIKKQHLAVLSTTHLDGTPQSAVIGFGENNDFEIFFGTSNTSRKYKNLQKEPSVSLVIGWDEGVTVQYEGKALKVSDQSEENNLKELYFSKSPKAKKYDHYPDNEYFKVIPRWIRYTDLNKDPWEIVELAF